MVEPGQSIVVGVRAAFGLFSVFFFFLVFPSNVTMIIISSGCIKSAHNPFVFIFTEWMVAQIRLASLFLVLFVSV